MYYRKLLTKDIGRKGTLYRHQNLSYLFNTYKEGLTFQGNDAIDNIELMEVHENFAIFKDRHGYKTTIPLNLLNVIL